jgi:hypothetical protein
MPSIAARGGGRLHDSRTSWVALRACPCRRPLARPRHPGRPPVRFGAVRAYAPAPRLSGGRRPVAVADHRTLPCYGALASRQCGARWCEWRTLFSGPHPHAIRRSHFLFRRLEKSIPAGRFSYHQRWARNAVRQPARSVNVSCTFYLAFSSRSMCGMDHSGLGEWVIHRCRIWSSKS